MHPHTGCPHCATHSCYTSSNPLKPATADDVFAFLMKNGSESWHETATRLAGRFEIRWKVVVTVVALTSLVVGCTPTIHLDSLMLTQTCPASYTCVPAQPVETPK